MDNMNQNSNNEGISFVELFSLFKKNIILIAVVTIVFTIIGGVYGKFIKKPVYSATATAVIQVDNSNMTEYNAFVYAQYLVNSMSEFIVSDNVTKEVSKVLIDEQYEIVHSEQDGKIVHFSNKEQKEYTDEQYEKLITAKASVVKGGTKISYNDESLILKITYSLEETNENTDKEVIQTVGLLIEKTKEVSVSLKNQLPTYVFPKLESIKSVIYAYEQIYDIKIITNESDDINTFSILSVEGEENTNFGADLVSLYKDIDNYASAIRENFDVYNDGDSLVLAVKNNAQSNKLDPKIVANSLVYLNSYAHENPKEEYKQEFLYPTFANKLVEMNNQPSYATKSTKTTLITIIAFIIGLALSCGIILVRFLLDDTFKSRTQLEEMTGINVLTSIPKFNLKEEENDEIK